MGEDLRVITDPAEFKNLLPGTYAVAGEAAKEIIHQTLVSTFRKEPHKPVNNGMSQCFLCGRPIHEVESYRRPDGAYAHPYWRHNPIPRTRAIPDRERRQCSKCGRPGEWYEFKPGSGECVQCQT